MGDVNQNSSLHIGIFLYGCMFTLFVLDLIHLDTTSSLKFQKVIAGCHGNTHDKITFCMHYKCFSYFRLFDYICLYNSNLSRNEILMYRL